MKLFVTLSGFLLLLNASAQAQIQVELKLKRLHYIAYEPIIASLAITNLAGRAIELRDDQGQHWFGFEVTAREGRPLAPGAGVKREPPLRIAAGETVTRRINLTPRYPVHDYGTYHLRANVYFADLNKFFYSRSKAFQVTSAHPIWQRTVGLPEGSPGGGNVRTYSLLTNRLPDHTSLYVRVENKDTGVVYATYSLGRLLSFDEPHMELDRANQLHVLQPAGPRSWAYSHIGLNGELLRREAFLETKSRPRLRRVSDGTISIHGGTRETAAAPSATAPKLSARPPDLPPDD